MKSNSNFNKALHAEDTDAEKAADLQHAALAKMAQGVQAPQTPPPAAATAPAASIAPVAPAPGAVMPHPNFPGLHAAFHPAPTAVAAAAPVKIAPAVLRKPFQRRI